MASEYKFLDDDGPMYCMVYPGVVQIENLAFPGRKVNYNMESLLAALDDLKKSEGQWDHKWYARETMKLNGAIEFLERNKDWRG